MTPLAQRVRRYAAARALWSPGARVLVALSGGADSVAALLLLHELAAAGDIVLAGAAHLNHGLRPDAADDEAFCRELCARLGVALAVERADIRGAAAALRASVEVAARHVRYTFLDRARLAMEADHIAVAHTRDDQAETVLLRLLRGAGTRGLRGILPVRGVVVRPLLEAGREELRRYLAGRGQTWREDVTNADVGHVRNRIRHELLPLLSAQYRPSVSRVLARSADVALEDDRYLEYLADGVASHVLTVKDGAAHVALPALRVLPTALQRRVARIALERAGCRRPARLADIDRLLAALTATPAARAVVAGVDVERFAENAVLSSRGLADGAGPLPIRELPAGGQVPLTELGPGWRLRATGPIREGEPPAGILQIVVAAGALRWPLRVRTRLPGDRMRPKGGGGSKKLQDLFVNRKVPRTDRDRIPVVVDAAGRILWVVGHAVAEGIEASEASDDVVVLSVERPISAGPEAS